MKKLHFGIAVLFVSLFIIACSKKDVDVTPPPAPAYIVEGIYSGKIGTGPAIPASQFELNLKKGGVIERINGNGAITGTGTWSLEGTTFTAKYQSNSNGSIIQLQGTLDKGKKRINGTWLNSGGNDGTYYVTKQ